MIIRNAQPIKGIGFNPISGAEQRYASKNQSFLNKPLQTPKSSQVINLTSFSIGSGILFLLGGAIAVLRNKHNISNVLKNSFFLNENRFEIKPTDTHEAVQKTIPGKSSRISFKAFFQALKRPYIQAEDFTPEPISWSKNKESQNALKYLGYELLGMLGISGGGYTLHSKFKKPEPPSTDGNPLNLIPHVPLQIPNPPPGRRRVSFNDNPRVHDFSESPYFNFPPMSSEEHLEYARTNNRSYPRRLRGFDPEKRGTSGNDRFIVIQERNQNTGIWTEIRRWNPASETFENITQP